MHRAVRQAGCDEHHRGSALTRTTSYVIPQSLRFVAAPKTVSRTGFGVPSRLRIFAYHGVRPERVRR
jgi:hypothetical protein